MRPSSVPRIRQGDCLELVPQLRSEAGPFKLIYVDPPFNAGGVRRARIKEGARSAGVRAYEDFWGGLDQFLDMLRPRLQVLSEALDATGSLWVHLDHRAVHDVKVMLDDILGRRQFEGEVIWVPGNGGKRRAGPSTTHQTILIYRRGERMTWNGTDPMLREAYAETSQRMHFTHTDSQGRRYRERRINGKAYRYYADEGRSIGSVWSDCPAMTANTPLRHETTGYPTQKPERLLERIIRGATHPGDAVLDPMCGSGTTVAVAARLGRRVSGCDLNPLACELALRRVGEAERTAPFGASPRRAGPREESEVCSEAS